MDGLGRVLDGLKWLEQICLFGIFCSSEKKKYFQILYEKDFHLL